MSVFFCFWVTRSALRILAWILSVACLSPALYLTAGTWGWGDVYWGNKFKAFCFLQVLEGTPLTSLDVVLTGSNACLFGKSIDDVKTIVQETDKVNFLIPLGEWLLIDNDVYLFYFNCYQSYRLRLVISFGLSSICSSFIVLICSVRDRRPHRLDGAGERAGRPARHEPDPRRDRLHSHLTSWLALFVCL